MAHERDPGPVGCPHRDHVPVAFDGEATLRILVPVEDPDVLGIPQVINPHGDPPSIRRERDVFEVASLAKWDLARSSAPLDD